MEPSMHVAVSPFAYGLTWMGIAGAYSVCLTFLAYQAAVYFYIPTKAPRLMSDLELYAIGVDRKHYPVIGSVCIAIAVLQVASLFQTMYSSFRQHKLQHKVSDQPPVRRQEDAKPFRRAVASIEVLLPSRNSWRRRVLRLIGASMMSLWNAFRVTNPNYGIVYVTREMIQTAIQTYQVYRLSSLVARAWMNRIAVTLLVLHCWATPIIKLTLRSSLGSTRLMCLLVNLALDFVSSIAFPVTLFLPYYAEFDPIFGDFPLRLWYSDVWLIQVINEWQMLLISSPWDALSKIFIAYNITRSLRTVSHLVSLRSPPSSSSNSIAVGPQPSLVCTSHSSTREVSAVSPAPLSPDPIATRSPGLNWRCRVERVGHIIVTVWGLGVLIAHIQSAITKDNHQCLVQVRPWFTTRPVCSLMEINCQDGKIHGDAEDFDRAIATIQREWLAYLIVRHCDAVEITPHIHNLPWLMAFKVHNSTLIRWDEDAGLTNTHNPRMLFVFMVVIKAQAVPPGLYAHDFPPKLYDIELSDWNVTSLPDAIVGVWPVGTFLVIEKFQFLVFPDALTKLQPSFLSIAFNNFTELPTEIWENDVLIAINVNGNPITSSSLPLEPWTSQMILQFKIMETLATELPPWVDATTVLQVWAGNTPLCSSLEANDAPKESNASSVVAAMHGIVDCSPAAQYRDLTSYPLNDETFNNPSRLH